MSSSEFRIEAHPEFGFLRAVPTPPAAVIARYYAEHFYSGEYKRFNNSSLEAQGRDRTFNDGHRDDLAAALVACTGRPLEGLRLLDIGCGYAQALEYWRGRGVLCHGFDPAAEAVHHARALGLDVVQAQMERMDVFPGLRFDIVTLSFVLEHMADPVATVVEIRDHVLKPGGLLLIEVPNDFNVLQRAACEVYEMAAWWIAPPAHLNYFCNDTLQRLMTGCHYQVRHAEATFPLEIFLLFGDNYVADRELGSLCHARRVAFEANLRRFGKADVLRSFYRSLAQQNLGRTIVVLASSPPK